MMTGRVIPETETGIIRIIREAGTVAIMETTIRAESAECFLLLWSSLPEERNRKQSQKPRYRPSPMEIRIRTKAMMGMLPIMEKGMVTGKITLVMGTMGMAITAMGTETMAMGTETMETETETTAMGMEIMATEMETPTTPEVARIEAES